MKSKKLSEKIIKTFKSNGFVLSEPDVLLDSEYIIQRSGENFRRSMLTFENEDGKIMCLRPDLTVASCIKFIEKKSKSKIYYSGQAYRRANNKRSDFINDQLGIEILGSKNQLQDDYKIIKTILNSAKKIIFIGTSFSVNITTIALRIAIARRIKIEIVDPDPVKLDYDNIIYHNITAEEYCDMRKFKD